MIYYCRSFISYLTLLKAPFRGIQFLVGMQYLTIKKCIPLIPLLLGVQHMMHPLKDQRGNAEFDGDAKSDVTPGTVTDRLAIFLLLTACQFQNLWV